MACSMRSLGRVAPSHVCSLRTSVGVAVAVWPFCMCGACSVRAEQRGAALGASHAARAAGPALCCRLGQGR